MLQVQLIRIELNDQVMTLLTITKIIGGHQLSGSVGDRTSRQPLH